VHRRDVALHRELQAHAADADRFRWHTFTGFDGASVSIDSFGASATGKVCLEKFGFTVDNVVATAK
jgi:transketolase